MLRRSLLYLFLALIIGCAPSQTVKKEAPEKNQEKKTSEAKKSYNIGFEYLKMKMYEDARTNFEKAIADSATYVDAYLALARVYDETKQYGLAEQTYNTLIVKVPDSVKGYTGLGTLYVKLKRYSESIAAYNKAEEIAPKDASVYFGLGYVYEQKKDYKKAEEYYLKAHNLDPSNKAIAYALGKIYLKLNKCSQALVLLEKIVKEFPKDPDAQLTLADAYLDCKNYKEALKHYKIVEPDLKEFGTIYLKEGKALEGLHRYSEAAEKYVIGIGKSEHKIIPYYNLINMYLKIKNYGKAQKYITQAFAIASNDPALNCMNGDVYIGYGDGARAKARTSKKKRDYEIAISHYKTAKAWYRKALRDAKWGTYAGKGIKIADSKIKNTKQEMWYGD